MINLKSKSIDELNRECLRLKNLKKHFKTSRAFQGLQDQSIDSMIEAIEKELKDRN